MNTSSGIKTHKLENSPESNSLFRIVLGYRFFFMVRIGLFFSQHFNCFIILLVVFISDIFFSDIMILQQTALKLLNSKSNKKINFILKSLVMQFFSNKSNKNHLRYVIALTRALPNAQRANSFQSLESLVSFNNSLEITLFRLFSSSITSREFKSCMRLTVCL